MNSIRFYNGVDTIGGTSIVFQNENERVIYGMGIAPRKSNFTMPSTFKERLLQRYSPIIDGVYKPELVQSSKPDIQMKTYDELNLDTYVFITHGHLDHMALIELLDPRVKIYVHQDAYNIHQAAMSANTGVPSVKMPDVHFYNPEQEYKIGEFTVTPILTDHNTISACSLIINFDGISLAYSGDYYYAGKHKDRVEAYVNKINNIDVFISESTTMSFLEDNVVVEPTEDTGIVNTYNGALNMALSNITQDNVNIMMLDNYNIEFLMDLYSENKKMGYNCLVQPGIAYVLKRFQIFDVDVLITSDIDQQKYISLSLTNKIFKLEDLNSIENLSIYIDSIDSLYSVINNTTKKHMFIDESFVDKNLLDKLHSMGVEVVNIHIGGHATQGNLLYTVDKIQPNQLMTIHTFTPERLLEYFKDKALPARKNFEYQVEAKKLVCKGSFVGKGYLVSTELDNALIQGSELSQIDIDGVNNFKKASDNIFVINTTDILPDVLAKVEPINKNCDYIVCSNGAAIYSNELKLLNAEYIEKTELLNTILYLIDNNIVGEVSIEIHFEKIKKNYIVNNIEELIDIKTSIISGDINNILAVRLVCKLEQLSFKQAQMISNNLQVTIGTFISNVDNVKYIDVFLTKKNCHKGSSLVFINKIEKANTITHISANFTDYQAISYSDRGFEINNSNISINTVKVSNVAEALKILVDFR